MVGHQAVSITQPVHALADHLEHIEKIVTVTVVEKDVSSAIATGGDMVKGIGR